MALGASGAGVVRGILTHTLALAGIGVGAGALVSLGGARLVASLLFGVAATDPVTFFGMALVLLLVAAAAGTIPATRAARTRGLQALRTE
jgi:putative ABC transport system permease protein